MSSHNRKSREELKEEYKQQFRKMRDARERYRQTRKSRNIVDALKDMDSSELMESFDSFLYEIQNKVTRAEARLDVALESMEPDAVSPSKQSELDETDEHLKAKETLQQVRAEMGLLYSELEEQAKQIDVDKSVGPGDSSQEIRNKT